MAAVAFKEKHTGGWGAVVGGTQGSEGAGAQGCVLRGQFTAMRHHWDIRMTIPSIGSLTSDLPDDSPLGNDWFFFILYFFFRSLRPDHIQK